jgi:peptidoglycan/LPS O-acetylase OafA/YrhL
MYLFFPLMVTYCRGVRRATVLLIGSIIAAYLANELDIALLRGRFTDTEVDNYRYFSFFNQLPIFALGNYFYYTFYRHAVTCPESEPKQKRRARLALAISLGMLAIAAFLPLPRSFELGRWAPPNFFFSALWMCLFVYGVAAEDVPLVTNKPVAAIGKVSFSAYLWHWLVFSLLCKSVWGATLTHQTRFAAIGAYAFMLILVTLVTYLVALISFRLVESSGMAASKVVVARRQMKLAAAGVVKGEMH